MEGLLTSAWLSEGEGYTFTSCLKKFRSLVKILKSMKNLNSLSTARMLAFLLFTAQGFPEEASQEKGLSFSLGIGAPSGDLRSKTLTKIFS